MDEFNNLRKNSFSREHTSRIRAFFFFLLAGTVAIEFASFPPPFWVAVDVGTNPFENAVYGRAETQAL